VDLCFTFPFTEVKSCSCKYNLTIILLFDPDDDSVMTMYFFMV
jgi:hypothetical protein